MRRAGERRRRGLAGYPHGYPQKLWITATSGSYGIAAVERRGGALCRRRSALQKNQSGQVLHWL